MARSSILQLPKHHTKITWSFGNSCWRRESLRYQKLLLIPIIFTCPYSSILMNWIFALYVLIGQMLFALIWFYQSLESSSKKGPQWYLAERYAYNSSEDVNNWQSKPHANVDEILAKFCGKKERNLFTLPFHSPVSCPYLINLTEIFQTTHLIKMCQWTWNASVVADTI